MHRRSRMTLNLSEKLREVYSNIKIKDIIDVDSICNNAGIVRTDNVDNITMKPDRVKKVINDIDNDGWIFKREIDFLNGENLFYNDKENEELIKKLESRIESIADFIDYVVSGETISLLRGVDSECFAEVIFNNKSFASSLLKIGINAKYSSVRVEDMNDIFSDEYEDRCYITLDVLASDEDIDRINKAIINIKSAEPFNYMINHHSEKIDLIGFNTNKFSDYIDFLNNIPFKDRLILMIEEMSELQKECTKTLRGKGDKEHFIEEIADVLITLTAGCRMMGITQKELDKIIISKSKRFEYDWHKYV